MEHVTLKGLVLRETDFGDNDRYISVLTEAGARIEVLCRGVRRRGGRMANAVRLFCWSELTLYQSRNKYTLNQADLISSFWGVTASMETYAMCCYLAELTNHMTDTDEACPAATKLMLYALRAVSEQKRDPVLVKAAFEMRLMAESGFEPDLMGCSVCSAPAADAVWFSPQDGVSRCPDCVGRLGAPGYILLLPGTLAALAHILTCEIPRVFAFALGGESLVQLAQVCEAYALCRAERGFDSLKFYHTLFPAGQSETQTF